MPGPPDESAEDLYENAPCGYLSTDPDGLIVRVNATFLRWTGHRREELVGRRRFAELLTGGGRIYHETHYAPLLRMQGSVREIALDIVRADGTRLPVLVNSERSAARPSARRCSTRPTASATSRSCSPRGIASARRASGWSGCSGSRRRWPSRRRPRRSLPRSRAS